MSAMMLLIALLLVNCPKYHLSLFLKDESLEFMRFFAVDASVTPHATSATVRRQLRAPASLIAINCAGLFCWLLLVKAVGSCAAMMLRGSFVRVQHAP